MLIQPKFKGIGSTVGDKSTCSKFGLEACRFREEIHRDRTLNSIPAMLDESDDEYRVIHYEDELDQDSQLLGTKKLRMEEEEEN
ncbi:hypothetical protein HAX54_035859 [Datura stramonium]|uniref:Uncharacterized protein n=1 Tax=Datura stramonium TaxID=4076 RepID=A0ABS8VHJ3_DATST|nr:hypothetical protein [Datura stramonium]